SFRRGSPHPQADAWTRLAHTSEPAHRHSCVEPAPAKAWGRQPASGRGEEFSAAYVVGRSRLEAGCFVGEEFVADFLSEPDVWSVLPGSILHQTALRMWAEPM